MLEMIRNAITNRKGVTAMEYAVIAAGIIIAIALTVEMLGQSVNSVFQQINDALT